MRDHELMQVQDPMPTAGCDVDVEETAPAEPQRALDDSGAETKMRAMRTICLSECAIPE